MSRRMSFALLCTLTILIFTPTLITKADGPSQAQGPDVLKVGIYLIRAGSLDISTGAIDVDFYLEFTCPAKCKDGITNFEVVNGTVKSKALVEDEETAFKPTYRVTATVFQEVSLVKYPFDSHEIKIVIEGNSDKNALVFEVNKATTAIDPNVFILGWELNHTPQARIVDQYYAAWSLHYDRYEFTTTLFKPALAGWLKGLLPAIFIALGSLFALYITTKNIGNRVAIITSALVASVLYHLNFTSRVPPIGYLTFGDIFMIINYIVILISLALTIWIIRSSDVPERQEFVKRVNKIEIVAIPVLWLVLHIINAIVTLKVR